MTKDKKDSKPSSASTGERIAKVLARAGVASRRDVERMIEAGRVYMNGSKVERAAINVTADDAITVDGKPVGEPDAPRLWLYHKPAGLVTSAWVLSLYSANSRKDRSNHREVVGIRSSMPRPSQSKAWFGRRHKSRWQRAA